MGYAKEKRPLLAGGFKSIGSIVSAIKELIVPLTAAQLIAMYTTPVSILPAPGAGKAIQVDSILFEMVRTATAFASGGAVTFQYHTTTTAVPHAGTLPATVLTTAGAGTTISSLGPNTGSNGLTLPQNEGIDITNATGVFATGTGIANVIVRYRIITLP